MRLSADRTSKILDANKQGAIERHLKVLQAMIRETDHCKCTVEAEKIGTKQDLREISYWNTEVETKIGKGEDEVTVLQQWLEEKKRKENYAQEEKLKFEIKREETRKPQMQAKIQHDHPGGRGTSGTIMREDAKGMSVRLPKMNIEQLDGSHMDCPDSGASSRRWWINQI